jgi:acyl carrier protein
MPMDDPKKVILAYVVKEYLEEGDDRMIDETTPLITSGIVDSFSMVSLKVFLEKKYAIRIPDEQATPAAFDSVTRIAELVTHIREAAPKAAVS